MKFDKLFLGFLIILFGVLMLGINLGWWNMNIWLQIVPFWPVILILVGIKLIFGQKSLTPLLILLIAVIGLALFLINYQ